MSIDIPEGARTQAIISIQRYLEGPASPSWISTSTKSPSSTGRSTTSSACGADRFAGQAGAAAATAQRSLADVARGFARRSSNEARTTSGATRA